jgi:hypothetical protein
LVSAIYPEEAVNNLPFLSPRERGIRSFTHPLPSEERVRVRGIYLLSNQIVSVLSFCNRLLIGIEQL